MKKTIITCLVLIISFVLMPSGIWAQKAESTNSSGNGSSLSKSTINKIESWIKNEMDEIGIPGISLVIVEGDKTVYKKGFGYADVGKKRLVTSETLFELGSTSKAFTALGILQLEEKGLINLSDPVRKYLPWFKVKYKGEYKGKEINDYVDITIEQLLHHTSGIPFKSIGDVPIAEDDDALERTVKMLVDKELDFYPGSRFLYATINYDILGLIIQKVSGLQYEDYMKTNVLETLGLTNTYLFRNNAPSAYMAKGYKVGLLSPKRYDAPMYRGSTPAAYFITNADDMAGWLKIQLGTEALYNFDSELISKSHIPDRSVPPNGEDGSSYAYGWSVYQDGGGQISHSGNNPNFSSYIVFRPQEKIGIALLANINTLNTRVITQGVMNIILGRDTGENISDIYISLGNISFVIICVTVPFILITLWSLVVIFFQIFRKERRFQKSVIKIPVRAALLLLFISCFTYCLYKIPDVLFMELPWSFVKVWAPESFLFTIPLLFFSVLLFCLYYLFIEIFPKQNDKPLFFMGILSLISGFGNALIIFIINEALYRDGQSFQSGLLVFFIMGILIYIYGQRLVRTKLINFTNDLVYSKRIDLINRILNTSYQRIEEIENEKILTGLNNDTETISSFANLIITGITSIITLVCCFIYLGIINFYGFVISVLVVFIAAGMYFVVSRSANKLWEQTRDIQNVFFKYINDLIGGFKELYIHNAKRNEFKQEMQGSCNTYRQKRILGDLKFTNVFVIGELIFIFVIGVVAFIFPVVFDDIQNSSLRNYVFVFLYMTGPVHGVLNAIPNAVQVRISWNRLNKLIKQLESVEENEPSKLKGNNVNKGALMLELRNVEYKYKNDGNEVFSIGPIDLRFSSASITFITGGNGSGKSTLAKLITGLYTPSDGDILVNGQKVTNNELSQLYSAIFSDFYLFEKLYGIDHISKKDELEEYLKVMRIEDKLQVKDGVFSTISLSTGQRKRLALIISYLEDRPILLFDEWAADQDPEFREFFYKKLLPELKNRGKCIIAITHDDRYFNIADVVVKMEIGKVLKETDFHGEYGDLKIVST